MQIRAKQKFDEIINLSKDIKRVVDDNHFTVMIKRTT